MVDELNRHGRLSSRAQERFTSVGLQTLQVLLLIACGTMNCLTATDLAAVRASACTRDRVLQSPLQAIQSQPEEIV